MFKFEKQMIIGLFHNRNIALTLPLIFAVGILTHAARFVVRIEYPARWGFKLLGNSV